MAYLAVCLLQYLDSKMENFEEKELTAGTIVCTSCGANLKYKSGTDHLTCEYCGAEQIIQKSTEKIEELDYLAHLENHAKKQDTIRERFVKCESCGASSSVDSNIASKLCPYCASPLLIEKATEEEIIEPKSLLPFKLNKNEAIAQFRLWIKKLWWAPNNLKKAILNFDHFKAIYIPYWTYDMNASSYYIGERGTYYWETRTYTTTENGKSVTKTEQVRRTHWTPTSGRVYNELDDLLVVGTRSLPKEYMNKLEPWDLQNLVPFKKDYLSGYITEKYQLDLEQGFGEAKQIAYNYIHQSVCRDIGGDEQRVLSIDSTYSDITFKHLLLPVFVSAYRYKEKLYQFLVNGRTGEVQGERPYSWIKITLAITAGIIVIAGLIYFFQNS